MSTSRRCLLGGATFALAAMASGCAHAQDGAAGQTGAESQFLQSLVAQSLSPLTRADFETAARSIGAETEALQAIAEVEGSGRGGYQADGRPIILFEPHIFSRRTNRAFDATHPNISYPAWSAAGYARTDEGRWAQLTEAYALNPDAALESTSWGLFQLMGFNYAAAGFSTAHAFVEDITRSRQRQLIAWVQWIVSNNLADEVQRRDWAGFARGYHGPSYASNRYDQRMAEAYARLTSAN